MNLGAKKWGHASHVNGRRMIDLLAKSDYFDKLVKKERRKYAFNWKYRSKHSGTSS